MLYQRFTQRSADRVVQSKWSPCAGTPKYLLTEHYLFGLYEALEQSEFDSFTIDVVGTPDEEELTDLDSLPIYSTYTIYRGSPEREEMLAKARRVASVGKLPFYYPEGTGKRRVLNMWRHAFHRCRIPYDEEKMEALLMSED